MDVPFINIGGTCGRHLVNTTEWSVALRALASITVTTCTRSEGERTSEDSSLIFKYTTYRILTPLPHICESGVVRGKALKGKNLS